MPASKPSQIHFHKHNLNEILNHKQIGITASLT